MLEFLALATSIIIATLLALFGLRAWRAKNGFIKWGGTSLAALLSTAAMLIGLIMAPTTKVAGTPEQIQRGKAISDGFCSACHSKTGTLTGGLDLGEHFPMPIGSFVSSNLTPVGQVSRWSDGDIFRAIRNSVDPDGRWLIIMSYTNTGKLSDEDIRAVIAYIRSLPAIGKPTGNPPDHLNLLGIDAGRRHAADRKSGIHRSHHGAAGELHLIVWRVHPVVAVRAMVPN
jgi:mono/diheme cytochrome c family protein